MSFEYTTGMLLPRRTLADREFQMEGQQRWIVDAQMHGKPSQCGAKEKSISIVRWATETVIVHELVPDHWGKPALL